MTRAIFIGTDHISVGIFLTFQSFPQLLLSSETHCFESTYIQYTGTQEFLLNLSLEFIFIYNLLKFLQLLLPLSWFYLHFISLTFDGQYMSTQEFLLNPSLDFIFIYTWFEFLQFFMNQRLPSVAPWTSGSSLLQKQGHQSLASPDKCCHLSSEISMIVSWQILTASQSLLKGVLNLIYLRHVTRKPKWLSQVLFCRNGLRPFEGTCERGDRETMPC